MSGLLHFSGNTMDSKESIKALGYHWEELEVGALGILTANGQKAWQKSISIDSVDAEIAKAKELGATVKNNIQSIDVAMYAKVKEEKDVKQAEINKLQKPERPAKLNGRWNGTIYNKKGSLRIYIDNNMVELTQAEADEINSYLKAKEEYSKAVSAINA